MRAWLKLSLVYQETIWYQETANDFFEATMSLNHFTFISRFIAFDDKNTRPQLWGHDNFSCMRSFFEKFNHNIATDRYHSSYLAVDETLCPYPGKIGFKQYNSSKPANCSLLYHSLCNAGDVEHLNEQVVHLNSFVMMDWKEKHHH